jgi:hypothetical protein
MEEEIVFWHLMKCDKGWQSTSMTIGQLILFHLWDIAIGSPCHWLKIICLSLLTVQIWTFLDLSCENVVLPGNKRLVVLFQVPISTWSNKQTDTWGLPPPKVIKSYDETFRVLLWTTKYLTCVLSFKVMKEDKTQRAQIDRPEWKALKSTRAC